LKILLYGLPNECKLLQLVLLHAKYLTWLKYYATETNPVKLGRGKMMNYNNNNNTKKKNPHPKREKISPKAQLHLCRKNLKIPTNPWKFPLKST